MPIYIRILFFVKHNSVYLQGLVVVCFATLSRPQHNWRFVCELPPELADSTSAVQPLEKKMTTSRRLADRKSAKFQKNILKRGGVPETTVKKGNTYPVGPIVLGFFVFIVIGSSIFQIIRTASTGGTA